MTQPNILLITVDACRADYVTPAANADTPAIASLAHEGTTFGRAISPAPWTLPSVSSLLTGRYPHEHGATSRSFETQSSTVVRDLSAAGYHCVHVSPKTWMGDWLPQGSDFNAIKEFTGPTHRRPDRGTDVRSLSEGVSNGLGWYTTVIRNALGSDAPFASLGNAAASLCAKATGDAWRDNIQASERAADIVDDLLGEMAERSAPFFVYVHLMDPHLPLYVPPAFESEPRPPGCDSRRAEHRYMHSLMDDIWAIRVGRRTLSGAELGYLRTRYADAVSYADSTIGSMLESLSERGFAGKTVVAVTADHGEHLGESTGDRALLGHQSSIRLPVLRVPLVIRGPEHFTGGEDNGLVQPHYLAETIRELAGLDYNPARSLLTDTDDRRETAIADYRGVVRSRPPTEYDNTAWYQRRTSAVEDDWKLDVVGSQRRAGYIDWTSNEVREIPPAVMPGNVRESLTETLSQVTDGDSMSDRNTPAVVADRLDHLGYR